MTEILNYIIQKCEFPEFWAKGLRSAIYKSGRYQVSNNYWGITIFPVLEKVFEIPVYKKLAYLEEEGYLMTYSLSMVLHKDYLKEMSFYVYWLLEGIRCG